MPARTRARAVPERFTASSWSCVTNWPAASTFATDSAGQSTTSVLGSVAWVIAPRGTSSEADHAFRHDDLRLQDRGRGQGLQPRGIHGPQDRPTHRALLPVRAGGLQAGARAVGARPGRDGPR